MDLKHDFWSILDQTTYLALGRLCLMAIILKTRAIPVATGQTRHALAEFTPV